MKILLVETSITGHHLSYMETLISMYAENEIFVVAPENYHSEILKSSCIFNKNYREKESVNYISWVRHLWKVIENVKPDIIHFLYGDDLYRFFGFGLIPPFCKSKVIVTCHQVRHGFLRNLSYMLIGLISDRVIVHTETLKCYFQQLRINNIVHIEYPQFSNSIAIDKERAIESLKITNCNGKVLLALGGTRKDKGLDILLNSLNNIEGNFHLIIAGKEEYFKKDYIENAIKSYRDKVTLILEFLDDEKFSLCLNAADIVVLPYRKAFDGASGPLGEGVWLRKQIIGPNHGSLGALITNNNLGSVFETENVRDLAKVINCALEDNWFCTESYEKYRQKMSTERFKDDYSKLYRSLIRV